MDSLDESKSRFRKTFCGATSGFRFLAALSLMCMVFAYIFFGLALFGQLGRGGLVVSAVLLAASFLMGLGSFCPLGCIFSVLAILSFVLFLMLMGAHLSGGVASGAPLENSPITLTPQRNELKSLNTSIATLQSTLKTNRQKRQALYTGPKSLQVKFQALKNAVKGQYGQDSAEAASVRGVKW